MQLLQGRGGNNCRYYLSLSQGGLTMIIADSAIHLSSQRLFTEEIHRKESLSIWNSGVEQEVQTDQITSQDKSKTNMMLIDSSVKVSLSSESIKTSSSKKIDQEEMEELNTDLNMRILKAIIERFTGKKIRMFKPADGSISQSVHNFEGVGEGREVQQGSGFGLAYDYHESHFEAESTSFSASGTILTSDGAEIDFSLDLNMSRQFYEENNISIRAGEALKDPLVINFKGGAADLTQIKFSFDIDADGTEDRISFVSSDSGFLVLDKNGDGEVNDGTELFGAMTGDGFTELSVYDEDGNGWIDENDTIYDKLQIWVKNNTGEDQLFAVGQKGVGAIFLGNLATSFDLKTDHNDLLGQVKSSGIFLSEELEVGTVQQVDLVV